jgi:hypothetical protein
MIVKRRKSPKYVPTPNPSPLMYDIPGIAGALSCTIWSVRELIAHGKLHASKLGHKFVVSRAELERFVADQQERAA